MEEEKKMTTVQEGTLVYAKLIENGYKPTKTKRYVEGNFYLVKKYFGKEKVTVFDNDDDVDLLQEHTFLAPELNNIENDEGKEYMRLCDLHGIQYQIETYHVFNLHEVLITKNAMSDEENKSLFL